MPFKSEDFYAEEPQIKSAGLQALSVMVTDFIF